VEKKMHQKFNPIDSIPEDTKSRLDGTKIEILYFENNRERT